MENSGFIHNISNRLRGSLFKLKLYANFFSSRTRISGSTSLSMDASANIVLGNGSRIVELGKIVLKPGAKLIIGNNTSIDRVCEIIIEENSSLTIGDNVFIGSHSNIRVTGEMKIGNDCKLAQFVSLINGNYGFSKRNVLIREQPYSKGFLFVGDDVWLGLSVVVLANVAIGKGAVVGAGTIVSKDVSEYAVVAGNPFKEIRTRE